ncbi:hypothetical protein CLV36_106204 [Laceyella sediminis]|uniref:t-SNARE coiled-coil homology domain-containing protein n=1 Tax=Laceyella sediminis TaxID=573074 RepID=A0ABX5EQX6_9BACL|nr:hypothetical protein [Laceyella sediminis]PRZ14440.1 hypothetical protein CLV36_106204 [Laceyella sediminis]
MEELLKRILSKLDNMEQRFEQRFNEVDKRFDEVDKRFDRIETELEDVKHIVRMSAQDTLENQIEFSEKSDLLDQRIRLLEERQNYTDKRVSRLEKEKRANEQ